MRYVIRGILALVLAGASAPAAAQEAGEAPTEVMVLGVYHFANPGRDVANVVVDDVLAPARQAELQALADALAQWRPTRILVEDQPDTPDLHLPDYRERADALIAGERSETYQIGFRLARQLGLEDVYGFDEHGGEGEPDYFPLGAVGEWAEANGRMDDYRAFFANVEARVNAIAADDGGCSIARNLMDHNDPALLRALHTELYYDLLPFGDAGAQPGAELNASWSMRNAKMFAKLDLLSGPGERVLVVVGSGHKYWLDHFVSMVPGHVAANPLPYLARADDGRCG